MKKCEWGQWIPYCPNCEEITLLTPIGYADAIQGYNCPECGDNFPIHFDFEKAHDARADKP
jgi:transposase-like protein